MQIEVNGDPTEVPGRLSIAGLLDHLGIKGERVAVEVNRVVIRREARNERLLSEGDRVEIVSFVGGG